MFVNNKTAVRNVFKDKTFKYISNISHLFDTKSKGQIINTDFYSDRYRYFFPLSIFQTCLHIFISYNNKKVSPS